jgi:hypothetical protein
MVGEMNMIDHTPIYICSHIFNNTHPILLVIKVGGDWQMLCAGGHDAGEIPRVVGLGHLLERDKTLYQILDLPDDFEAERKSLDEPWIRTKCEPDD